MIEAKAKTKRGFRDSVRTFLGSGEEDSLRTYLIGGAAGILVLKVMSTGLGFLKNLLLARLLGATEYGIYTYVFAWVGLLSIVGLLGFEQLTVREIAAYRTKSSWGLMRGLLRWASLTILFVSVGLSLTAGIAAWLLKGYLDLQIFPAFWIAVSTLPLITLTSLRNAAMRGLKHAVYGMIPGVVISPLLFIALILFASQVITEKLNAAMAAGSTVMASGIAFAVGVWMLYRILPRPAKEFNPEYQKRGWLISALPLLVSAGLQEVNSRAGVLMTGSMAGAEAAGIYSVANLVSGVIGLALIAVNVVLAPVISSLYASGHMRRLQRIITNSARIMLVVSMFVAFSLILFREGILGFFGQDFHQAETVLIILCVGQLISTATGSVGLLLIMTGYEKDIALGMGAATILNLILNAILIPSWGIEGAGVATASSIVLWNILLFIYVHKRLGIDPTALGKMGCWTKA